MKQLERIHPLIKNNFLDNTMFFTKLIIVIVISLFLILIKFFCDLLIPKFSIIIPKFFHKLIVWLINIKIIKEGQISKHANGILFISNHLSYLDIPILGSLLSAKFVAKDEVSRWPIFGWLARIGNTIFIKRLRKNVFKEKDSIRKEIDDGYKVILFPEGTTSDGIRILNFKSSLLSSVENQDYLIQPIIIKYEYINGLPLNRCLKPIIAWYGDMGLKKHLLNVLRLISITARVRFLNPIFTKDFEDRKSMTFAIENVIFNEYSQKNNGN